MDSAKKVVPGEIWLAKFHFNETSECKLRPVLVYQVTPVGAQVIFCSTKKLCVAFPSEVVLTEQEAKAIGLNAACRMDFGKRDMIPLSELSRKVGDLGPPGERLSLTKFREMARAAMSAGLA